MADTSNKQVLVAALAELCQAPTLGPELDSSNYDTCTAVDYRPERDQLYETLCEWSNDRFRRQYRMNRSCFDLLVHKLRLCPSANANIPVPGTGLVRGNSVPPEHRILIALRYLATPDLISSLAIMYNVTDSMVFDYVTLVCNTILELEPEYIKWPSVQEMGIEEKTFFTRHGFPGCIGCIDGTEVQITKPIKDGEVYFNRKKNYSLNTMLVVNSAEEVVHYNVGSPGSYHDARVFRRSQLPEILANIPAQYHLLGDSAYSLSTSLLKPFPETPNNPRRVRHYNYLLSATRCVIENANARLKNKWMRLKFIRTRSVSRAKLIIRACVILHNFVIRHDSTVDRATEARNINTLIVGTNEINKRELISHQL